MKANNNGMPERIDKEFSRIMREIMKIRFEKGLAKFNSRELGFAESTRLLMRAPSFKKVIEELRTLPKKENII